MRSRTAKTLRALFLLNLSICCLAMRPELVEAKPNRGGIRIESASCRGREYSAFHIYNHVMQGLKSFENMKALGLSENLAKYTPKDGEKMPFKDRDYYFINLHEVDFQSNYNDLAIFTYHGKLAKVVSHIRDGPRSRWYYEDCILIPKMVSPEENNSDEDVDYEPERSGVNSYNEVTQGLTRFERQREIGPSRPRNRKASNRSRHQSFDRGSSSHGMEEKIISQTQNSPNSPCAYGDCEIASLMAPHKSQPDEFVNSRLGTIDTQRTGRLGRPRVSNWDRCFGFCSIL